MSDEEKLDNGNFELEGEAAEEEAKDKLHVEDYDVRRRLENQLEERRIQKMIQDFDFDLD